MNLFFAWRMFASADIREVRSASGAEAREHPWTAPGTQLFASGKHVAWSRPGGVGR